MEEALPAVTVVVERFHLAPSYRHRGDPLRKQELKRLKQERPAAAYEPLKGFLWRVRQDWTALSAAEQDRLLSLFRYSPALQQASGWRQLRAVLFPSSCTKAHATEAIERWREPVRASGLHWLDGFVTTVANWREEISHYFLQRQRSGVVEGLNNKRTVVKRRCYGRDSGKTLFQRLWLDLEGYRLFGTG